MNKNIALTIAGIVFAIVALMHLLRLFLRFDIIVAGQFIPLWVNALGFVVALVLCIWMFTAVNSK